MEEKVRRLLEKHKEDKDLTSEKDYIEPGWDWSEADLTGWNLMGLKLSSIDIDKNANFRKAILSFAVLKQVDLQGAKLNGANLQRAYLEKVNLENARLVSVNLQKAVLLEGNLQKSNLENANLKDTILIEADLQDANLNGVVLQNAYLQGTNLRNAILSNVDFRDAKFDEKTVLFDTNLFRCRIENSTLKYAINQIDKIVVQEKAKNYIDAKNVYLILKNYFKREGMNDISGEYYYREKLMETKCFWKEKRYLKWLGNHLLHKIAGFGEKPLWVLLWWLGIIFVSAFIYWICNGIMTNNINCYDPTFCESIYFSIVTFTTLGFGDLAPKPGFFQIFASIESLLGAILMAMFIFVFARKMIR